MSNEDGSSPAFPTNMPLYDSGLSQRAYAAIHLRVPDSGLPWLDAMIERARREDTEIARIADMEHQLALGRKG